MSHLPSAMPTQMAHRRRPPSARTVMKMALLRPVLSRWQGNRYVVAVVIIAGAAALRAWPLQGMGTRMAWLTFYPAVMTVAIYGGLWVGLLLPVIRTCSLASLLSGALHSGFGGLAGHGSLRLQLRVDLRGGGSDAPRPGPRTRRRGWR